jgi:hypothetical protein
MLHGDDPFQEWVIDVLCSGRAACATESDQRVRDRRARDPVNPE